MTKQTNVYPPLAPALAWSRELSRCRLHASLAILLADNLAALGETPAAVTALGEARGMFGRGPLAAGDLGARMNMVVRADQLSGGQVAAGDAGVERGAGLSTDRLAVDVSDSVWSTTFI